MLVAQADHLHIAECRSISGQKISSVYKSRITVTHIVVLVLSGADKCDQENEERANPYQMCKFIDKMHIWKALRQVGHIFLTNSSTRDDIAAQIPKDPRRFYKHNPEDNPIRAYFRVACFGISSWQAYEYSSCILHLQQLHLSMSENRPEDALRSAVTNLAIIFESHIMLCCKT